MLRTAGLSIVLSFGCTGTLDAGAEDASPARDGSLAVDDAGLDGGRPARSDAGDAGPGCAPTTCEALGAECGSAPDGCGGALS